MDITFDILQKVVAQEKELELIKSRKKETHRKRLELEQLLEVEEKKTHDLEEENEILDKVTTKVWSCCHPLCSILFGICNDFLNLFRKSLSWKLIANGEQLQNLSGFRMRSSSKTI